MTASPQSQSIARRHVRAGALGFLLLGIAALAFDLMSRNAQQMRYVLGAGFLISLSALTFLQARD
jgi:hypothetical protein